MKVEKLKRTEGKAYAIIKCSNCLLEERYDQGVGILSDPVDIYAMLVDAFYGEAGDKQNEPISIITPGLVKPEVSISELAAQTVQVPTTQPVQQAQVVQSETPEQPVEQSSPSVITKAEESKPVPTISGLKVKDRRKKAKSEEKVSLAELENKEEITEDFLKEVYLVDEDEEVLDDIKKEDKEKKEKLPFIDVDLDDEDEDDTFK